MSVCANFLSLMLQHWLRRWNGSKNILLNFKSVDFILIWAMHWKGVIQTVEICWYERIKMC